MFVSDFPMSGSLLEAARCPETLTSPAKHAQALFTAGSKQAQCLQHHGVGHARRVWPFEECGGSPGDARDSVYSPSQQHSQLQSLWCILKSLSEWAVLFVSVI